MKNRNMLTFGLAAGLVALVGTCLIAKEKQSDAADKAKETAAVEKAKEPTTRTQVETSVTTNNNMVTERRRETTTTTDADGNVIATSTTARARACSPIRWARQPRRASWPRRARRPSPWTRTRSSG